MKYPKIETLFNRYKEGKEAGKVNEDEIRNPVFEYIDWWLVTEKLDGMNVRILLSREGNVSFGGKTDNATLPSGLLDYLTKTFTPEKMKKVWVDEPYDIILFGEGYGNNIQKNGRAYNPNYSFRLFDIFIGRYWLDWEDIEKIAEMLEIETVPQLDYMDTEGIIYYVRNGFDSIVSREEGTPRPAEGIVARTPIPLFTKVGDRVMFKLKTKDFFSDEFEREKK